MKNKIIRIILEGETKDGVRKEIASLDQLVRKDTLFKKFRVIKRTHYLREKGE